MFIKKLKVKNFAALGSQILNFDSYLIGVIGGNGKGKSTVLAAIDFALSGTLPDKNESWITFGEDTSEVSLEFSHSGKDGIIVRGISKNGNSTRLLKWDGNEYVKSADVDKMLLDIFGANSKARKSASYNEQGRITRWMENTSLKTLEDFIKLLNLEYLEKKASEIDKYCQRYKSTADLIHKINEDIIVLDQNKFELENKKKQHENDISGEDIGKLRKLYDNIKLYEQYDNSIISIVERAMDLRKAYRQLEQKISTEFNEDLMLQFPAILEKFYDLQTKYNLFIDYQNKNSEAIILEKEIEALKKKLNSDDPFAEDFISEKMVMSISIISEEIKNEKTKYENIKEFEFLKDAVQKTEKDKEVERQKIEKISKSFDINSFDKVKLKLETIREMANDSKKMYDTLTKMCGKVVDGKCNLCGLSLLEKNVNQEHINVAKENYQNWFSKLKIVEEEYNRLLSIKEEVSKTTFKVKFTIDALNAKLEDYNNRLKDLITGNPDLDVCNAEDIRNKITNFEEKLKQLQLEYNIRNENKNILKYKIKEYNNIKLNIVVCDDCSKEYNEIKKVIEENQDAYKKYEKIIKEKETIIDSGKKLNEERIKNKNLKDQLVVYFENNGNINIDDLENEKNNIFSKLQIVSEIKGKIITIESRLKEIETNRARLIIETEKLEKDINIYNKLSVISSLLKRDGIPYVVACETMKTVLEVTNEFLNELDSGFTLVLHEEDGFNLMFKNQEENICLPVKKLSGGQKVRAGICFSLAINFILLPDYGFIIFDEPTNHLDESGVQNLVSVLTNVIKAKCENNFQIMVVDHNPLMEPAFSTLIRL